MPMLKVTHPLTHDICNALVNATVPLDLNFTNTRVQKATARNIHSNAPE